MTTHAQMVEMLSGQLSLFPDWNPWLDDSSNYDQSFLPACQAVDPTDHGED